MKKIILSFILCLSFVIPLQAEVHIPSPLHQKNSPHGMCVWASVETLARHHKITSLIGIFSYYNDWRDEWGTPWTHGFRTGNVQKQLEHSGIKGWCIENADESWVWWAVEKDLGCVIGLKDYPGYGDNHAVVLTEINNKEVHFIDSNHPGRFFSVSLEWFRSHWSGFFVALEKP